MTNKAILALTEDIAEMVVLGGLQDALNMAYELVGALEAKCASRD